MDHSDAEIRGPTPRTTPVRADAASTKAAEDKVPLEWNVDDVILDLYEVKQVHRTGGMGLVYRVRHRNWNIDLAVKSPRAGFFETESQKRHFVGECEKWMKLGLHPNTVSCYYVRNLGRIPRVFAEYVEGGSLKDWIDNRKLYEGGKEKALERILDTGIQFAWALHFAHKKGLVHQDVKPTNVMMTEDGTAKVTDFGLAKARAVVEEATGSGSEWSILVSCGGMTRAYRSPEQANMQRLSRKTDIWSWGLSVLQMFTGEVTWTAGEHGLQQGLERYLKTSNVDKSIPMMPDGLAELLRQCFRRDPTDRPKNMREIVKCLRQIYQDVAGNKYSRPEPKEVELLADALNNQAISMLDLGREEEAERLFEDALKLDSRNVESAYNRGLLKWRNGQQTDADLVLQLQQSSASQMGSWRPRHLLALVHLERGDERAAEKALTEAARLSPNEREVRNVLARIPQEPAAASSRVLGENERVINAVAVTPDGSRVLAGGLDDLRLWHIDRGECLQVFAGPERKFLVDDVAITPDGRRAVSVGGYPGFSSSKDKTGRLWDLETGECLRILKGHKEQVLAVALTPRGHHAVTGSWDRTLRLWDLESGRTLRVFNGHGHSVNAVTVTPDGQRIVSGSSDDTLRLWSLKSARCLRVLEGHQNTVTAVAVTHDGHHAVSGSWDGTLRLWDLESGRTLRVMAGNEGWIESVAVTPDGRLAVCTDEFGLRLWNLAEGRCLRSFALGVGRTEGVDVVPDGRFAICGHGAALTVLLLDGIGEASAEWAVSRPRTTMQEMAAVAAVRTQLDAARDALRHGRPAESAAAARRGRALPGYEHDPDLIDLWCQAGLLGGQREGLRGGWCVQVFKAHESAVTVVVLTPDENRCVTGSQDQTLRLWHMQTWECLRVFEGYPALILSAGLTPDGRYLVCGGYDKSPHMWEMETGRLVHVFEGHEQKAKSVALTPDGHHLVSASDDATLRVWSISTGECVRILEGHGKSVYFIAITPDGRSAVSCGGDSKLRIWDLATGECTHICEGGRAPTTIMPDGRHALTLLSNKYVQKAMLVDLVTGQPTRYYDWPTDWGINALTVTPDGRFAFTASSNRQVGVWDVETGKFLLKLEGHTNDVRDVTLSADACLAASVGWDHTLRLWQLDWDYVFPGAKDWDETARPYLEFFLILHTPHCPDGFSRSGSPTWTEEDFKKLLDEIQRRGYGWLRPEGVRKKLEEMTANWQGPPRLTEID